MFAVEGAALGISQVLVNTTTYPLTPPSWGHAIFGSSWGQFNVSIAWSLAVVLLATWILHKARFGNWIFATGGDVGAAVAAGVPARRVKVLLFMGTAVGAALVGVLQAVQYDTGGVTTGANYVFDAPTAAVIGGVLLGGGYGSAVGGAFGAMIYAIVNQGIYYTSLNSVWVDLVIGFLLLIAVLTNNTFRRLALAPGPLRRRSKE